MSDRKIQE